MVSVTSFKSSSIQRNVHFVNYFPIWNEIDDKEGYALRHGYPVFDKLLPRLVPGVLGQIQSVYNHKTVVHKPMSDVMVGLYLTGSLVLPIYSRLGRDKRIQRKQTLKSKHIRANLSKKR